MQELNAESDEEQPPRQAPAEAQMEADDDEELLADPPPQAPHAADQPAPRAPPESDTTDFWARMEQITTRQSNVIRQDLNFVATHLDNKTTAGPQTLETKLTTDLRRLENATTKNADDISTLTKRVCELEMRRTPEAYKTPNAAPTGGWQQNHVIIGGWPDPLPTPGRIAIIQQALTSTPGHLVQALKPFAPRDSSIVKIRFSSETVARQGHFRIQKSLQGLATTRPDLTTCGPPLKGPLRSPCFLMSATDSFKAMVGPDVATMVRPRPDLPAGAICFNQLPVLEINANNDLDITALWATCPALAPHSWRRVSTVRKE